MTDRRRSTGQSGQEQSGHEQSGQEQSGQHDNPFAPPPADRPDQPWQPRHRPEDEQDGDGSGSASGPGSGTGSGDEPSDRKRWGSQWSSRQPGRGGGGFGSRNGGEPKGNGNGKPDGSGGLRWDPRDPVQRHSRYALLSGMWGFFFALFNIPPVALLLGALALYWGISALRGAPGATRKDGDAGGERRGLGGAGGRDTPGPAPAVRTVRQQTTAAISGIVIGSLSLLIVAATFSFQLIYQDYYHCVDDALTTTSREACERHLPERLRPLLGERD
ncbi:hypothetical protein QNO07_04930 [Streptomyces sp. 549]|uniref:hypothetical protein n=1 Tax=Streptomyces sp. 549 TaxID=3049076 RepID=UPI0024C33EF7|nr:hypothetical protein [Streptomyces sp. 549]MDK1472778.1 hypothetical protein [Streptomyces sp. 549]